jgi:N-acetylglucosaminyldiphosphoundecaprenol N-acetyl-beta-D-mannosaminyltransferase
MAASGRHEGGWVATPNIDICRQSRRDPALRSLVETATLIVPDGMPLVWAARLRGCPLPERVAGGSLIFSLTEAAARHGRSIYLLGGAAEVPYRAAVQLRRRYPGLVVAGADAPPPGFHADPDVVETVRGRLAAAAPDIVYVGLGFPKQEQLIANLAPSFPATWFVGCGAAIPYAAGTLPRPPQWMRGTGLAWLFRLSHEPRRLFRRYLVDDLPFALALLAAAAAERLKTGHQPASGPGRDMPLVSPAHGPHRSGRPPRGVRQRGREDPQHPGQAGTWAGRAGRLRLCLPAAVPLAGCDRRAGGHRRQRAGTAGDRRARRRSRLGKPRPRRAGGA